MRRKALIQAPPTRADLAVARVVADRARPAMERGLRVLTVLADERALIAGTAAFWLYARLAGRNKQLARRADHLALCALASAAVPHLLKKLVDRERPDRHISIPRRRRHSIKPAGRPFDSFPSGHAVHVGAIAAAASRWARPGLRPVIWSGAAALAFSRVLLLAHYPTDVAAGRALGVGLDGLVEWLRGSRVERPRRPRSPDRGSHSSARSRSHPPRRTRRRRTQGG